MSDNADNAAISAVFGLDDWHEDDGAVLWWHPDEAPWVGTPNDSDWPGYHELWTPLPDYPL